jgi:hypothetical protein
MATTDGGGYDYHGDASLYVMDPSMVPDFPTQSGYDPYTGRGYYGPPGTSQADPLCSPQQQLPTAGETDPDVILNIGIDKAEARLAQAEQHYQQLQSDLDAIRAQAQKMGRDPSYDEADVSRFDQEASMVQRALEEVAIYRDDTRAKLEHIMHLHADIQKREADLAEFDEATGILGRRANLRDHMILRQTALRRALCNAVDAFNGDPLLNV